GIPLWSKRVGGAGNERGYSIAVDQAGDVIVAGSFEQTVDFGGGPLTSAGSRDVFIAKYSGLTGAHVWSKRFGSVGDDYGYGVGADPDGNVVLAGAFAGTVDFGGGAL